MTWGPMAISTPSSPILSFWRPLGVANYGTKEISGHRKDIQKNFWGFIPPVGSDLCVHPALCLVVLGASFYAKPCGLYLGAQFGFKGTRHLLAFQGLEDFRKITVRNITVKLVGVISIFLFVKSANDLYLYVFLLTIFELLGQLSVVTRRNSLGKPILIWPMHGCI